MIEELHSDWHWQGIIFEVAEGISLVFEIVDQRLTLRLDSVGDLEEPVQFRGGQVLPSMQGVRT